MSLNGSIGFLDRCAHDRKRFVQDETRKLRQSGYLLWRGEQPVAARNGKPERDPENGAMSGAPVLVSMRSFHPLLSGASAAPPAFADHHRYFRLASIVPGRQPPAVRD